MKAYTNVAGASLLAISGALAVEPPTNDSFANRLRFTGENVSVTANSAGATREADEPDLFHGLGVTLWWAFTAPKNGKVRLTGTVGDELYPNPDVRGRMFTGDSLARLQDYWPAGFLCSADGSRSVTFEVVAGQEYEFLTDTVVPSPFIGYRGPVTLHVEYLAAPANDAFANRLVLHGEAVLAPGGNEGATREPGEPEPFNSHGQHTVWYEWTSPGYGMVEARIVAESPANFRVSVYTNAPLETLAPVGTGGNSSFLGHEQDRFYLSVSSPFNASGPFQLALSFRGRPVLGKPDIGIIGFSGITVPVYGASDGVYRVETSTNLVHWEPLGSGGYVDQSPLVPMRFYRAVAVP